jgi:hypothetical protein
MAELHLDVIWTESKAFLERLLSELTDDSTRNVLLIRWLDRSTDGWDTEQAN